MNNNKYDLAKILKFELKQRNNPTDLKAVNIGVVEQLSPLIVSISENKIYRTLFIIYVICRLELDSEQQKSCHCERM